MILLGIEYQMMGSIVFNILKQVLHHYYFHKATYESKWNSEQVNTPVWKTLRRRSIFPALSSLTNAWKYIMKVHFSSIKVWIPLNRQIHKF